MHTNSKPRGLILALVLTVPTVSIYFLLERNRQQIPVQTEQVSSSVVSTINNKVEPQPITQETLIKLKKTYERTRTSPSRIRIQSFISEIPPSELPVVQLFEEISDHNAPTEYKLFLARTLRNASKFGLSNEKRSEVVQRFHALIRGNNEDGEFLAGLAYTLIDTDESLSSINHMAALAHRLSDDTNAAATIAAIARSNTPHAKSALLDFALSESQADTPRSKALAEALRPLSFEHDIPLERTLHRIISNTQYAELFVTAIEAVRNRPPSDEKSRTIEMARSRVASFPPETHATLFNSIQSQLVLRSSQQGSPSNLP